MCSYAERFRLVRRAVVSKSISYLKRCERSNGPGLLYVVSTSTKGPVFYLPRNVSYQINRLPPLLRIKTQNIASTYCNRNPRFRAFFSEQYSTLSQRLSDNIKKTKLNNVKSGPVVSASAATQQSLPLHQRLKKLFKEYWYVAIPVHIVTSAVWFGSSYFLVLSGLDVIGIMEWIGIPERWIEHLRDKPAAGTFVFALAFYKLLTPLRYIATIACTGVAVRYLTRFGYIKPFPTKQHMRERYVEMTNRFRERKSKPPKRHQWPE